MTSIRETPVRGNTATQGLHALADAVIIWKSFSPGWWKISEDVQAWADVLRSPQLSQEWADHQNGYDAEYTPAMHNRDARLLVACLLQRRIDDADLGDLLRVRGILS